jgi:hypothetical protein
VSSGRRFVLVALAFATVLPWAATAPQRAASQAHLPVGSPAPRLAASQEQLPVGSPAPAPAGSTAPGAGPADVSPAPSTDLPASPGPLASTDPGSSPVPSLRPGWTLEASTEPAFSVQLPPGWLRDPLAEGFAATSDAGELLIVAPRPLSEEPTFEAWVGALEAGLEEAAGTALPTVFRQAGSGLVARIELGAAPDGAPGDVLALFLFPSCADGPRTLTISGPPPTPNERGAPDAWDAIAARVNPCATEPAPERVLDPQAEALAGTYFRLASAANAAITEAYAPLTRRTTIATWREQARDIAAIERRLIADLVAIDWPESVGPLVDRLVARHRAAVELWGQRFGKAKRAKDITSRFEQLDRVSVAIGEAGRDLRFALGLPTNPS